MPFLVLLATALAAAASAQQPSSQPPGPPATPAAPPAAAAPEETVLVTDVVKGMGDEAFPGMVVIVHYTGWLYDAAAPDHHGRQFDSSRDRGQPLSFPLGSGRVIRGWEQGIPGMKVGGRRQLVCPPELAYGPAGGGHRLSGKTLVFVIDLLGV